MTLSSYEVQIFLWKRRSTYWLRGCLTFLFAIEVETAARTSFLFVVALIEVRLPTAVQIGLIVVALIEVRLPNAVESGLIVVTLIKVRLTTAVFVKVAATGLLLVVCLGGRLLYVSDFQSKFKLDTYITLLEDSENSVALSDRREGNVGTEDATLDNGFKDALGFAHTLCQMNVSLLLDSDGKASERKTARGYLPGVALRA
jgi:hypothetical protein